MINCNKNTNSTSLPLLLSSFVEWKEIFWDAIVQTLSEDIS